MLGQRHINMRQGLFVERGGLDVPGDSDNGHPLGAGARGTEQDVLAERAGREENLGARRFPFTTTTMGAAAISAELNIRPASSGIWSVRK